MRAAIVSAACFGEVTSPASIESTRPERAQSRSTPLDAICASSCRPNAAPNSRPDRSTGPLTRTFKRSIEIVLWLTFHPFQHRAERTELFEAQRTAHLVVLTLDRDHHVFHFELLPAPAVGALQTRVEHDGADMSAGEWKTSREEI